MKTRFYISIVFALLLAGCSSSRITYSWKSDSVPVKTYNKIIVVALIKNNDLAMREKMEAHLVGDLSEHGYTVISSLKEYGPKSFENISEQEAISKLKSSGVDAVVTIVLLDKKREQYYVPGRVFYSPYTIYQRRFWGYYSTIYDRIYSPGYYQVDTRYFWESNFYEGENRELLYSAQTKSFDPASTETLAHQYGKLIVADMAKNGIIK